MNPALFALIMMLGASPARGAQNQPPPSAEAEYNAALEPGLGDSTSVRLTRFLAEHPRHPLAPAAQFELGRLAYAKGAYAEARERFRRARNNSTNDEARYWEGLASFALGRPREARDAVQATARSAKALPRRWDSAYLVALSWAQEGRRPEALAAYRQLFDLPAGSAQAAALYQAQRLARELARNDESAQWGKRLLTAYPKSPEAASLRAEATPAPPSKSPAKGR